MSYLPAVLTRRITWLLALLMAIPAAYGVPASRTGRHAETWEIICLLQKRCERNVSRPQLQRDVKAVRVIESLGYRSPQGSRFTWPCSYQRPPTRSRLA